MSGPRHTARGLVMHNSQLLLMERWRQGRHYFSIPGGGIEKGETGKDTVVREILEETGCVVTVDRLLYVMRMGEVTHSIYLCKYVSGEPQLMPDSPEALRNDSDNRFEPRWLPLAELGSVSYLIWRPAMQRFLHDMAHGFPAQPAEIIAPAQP